MLASLLVERVLTIPLAVFFELNTLRIVRFILFCSVIAALTFSARKCYKSSHYQKPFGKAEAVPVSHAANGNSSA